MGALLRLMSLAPDRDLETLPLEQARAQVEQQAGLVGGPKPPMALVEDVRAQRPPYDAGTAARWFAVLDDLRRP